MKHIIMIKINSTTWESYIDENGNEFIYDTYEEAVNQMDELINTTTNVYKISSYPQETI